MTASGITRRAAAMLAAVWMLAGCAPPRPGAFAPGSAADVRADPLPIQQMRAYEEAATGRFLSLADFEDSVGGAVGSRQVRQFSVFPAGQGGSCQFSVKVTRTGAGAIEVTLAPGSELVFRGADVHDFSGYSLLSFALHSRDLRDDLTVALDSPRVSWTSPPALIQPGWNTVSIDIRQLRQAANFDVTRVQAIRLAFAEAQRPVEFHLDDLLLIDNRRRVEPTPPGVTFEKAGLEYSLQLPLWPGAMALAQGGDGLWRFDTQQPVVQMAAAGQVLGDLREDLQLMGRRRIGQVEVLETSPVRLRLANTWYFPAQSGEWVSMGVREIQWQQTFYPDGRWVTHVVLNNAGGSRIGAFRLALGGPAAWAGDGIRAQMMLEDLAEPVRKWSFLRAAPAAMQQRLLQEYIAPGRVEVTLGDQSTFAPGDVDQDRFDESQGCYFLQAKAGHCRFTLHPPAGGLTQPVFRIAGPWPGPVAANSEGLALRNLATLPDGSALLMLPGRVERAVSVEVTGSPQ